MNNLDFLSYIDRCLDLVGDRAVLLGGGLVGCLAVGSLEFSLKADL